MAPRGTRERSNCSSRTPEGWATAACHVMHCRGKSMKRFAIALAAVIALLGLTAVPAYAQSGHFIENGAGAPVCTDIGTQVTCTGKVAGLGGTTFEITIEADGVASVECTNPGHRGHRRGQHGPASDTATGSSSSVSRRTRHRLSRRRPRARTKCGHLRSST
jgi:hypothetical protein